MGGAGFTPAGPGAAPVLTGEPPRPDPPAAGGYGDAPTRRTKRPRAGSSRSLVQRSFQRPPFPARATQLSSPLKSNTWLAFTSTGRPCEVGGANFHWLTAATVSAPRIWLSSGETQAMRTAPVSSM